MWVRLFVVAFGLFVIFKITLITYRRRRYPEPHEDWSVVNLDDVSFPEDFRWGTATAAHQVEGNLVNNWTVHEAAKGLEPSGEACDHWRRWKEDFQLLSDLGLDSYRFSVAWSRLEPKESAWNHEAMDVYSAMVDDLLAGGIRPVVTLHHHIRTGGKPKEALPTKQIFPRSSRFASGCLRFCPTTCPCETINEPTVFSTMGYTLGMFPPGRRSVPMTLRVMRNLLRAHAKVYRRLKTLNPDVQIGVAKNVTLFDPKNRWSPIDWPLARLMEWFWNGAWRSGMQNGRMFFKDIPEAKGTLDFVGLNYYTHVLVGLGFRVASQNEVPQAASGSSDRIRLPHVRRRPSSSHRVPRSVERTD